MGFCATPLYLVAALIAARRPMAWPFTAATSQKKESQIKEAANGSEQRRRARRAAEKQMG
jgi:hypothetical protein